MKTKLLAIVLSLLMLVQPVMAIGMVGMESTAEIAATIPEEVQEENQTAELNAMALTGDLIVAEDFEDHENYVVNVPNGTYAPLTVDYSTDILTKAAIRCGDQAANISVVDLNDNKVLKLEGGDSSKYRMITLDTSKLLPGTHDGVYTVKFAYRVDSGNGSGQPSVTTRLQGRKYNADASKWESTYINPISSFKPTLDKWYVYSYTFEIKNDGYFYYFPQLGDFKDYKAVLTSAENGGTDAGLSRFDIVLEYPAAVTDEALVYVDDLTIEYVPAGEFPSAAPENAVIYEDLERIKYIGGDSSLVKGNISYKKTGYENANLYHGAGWLDNAMTQYSLRDEQGRTWRVTNGDDINSLSVRLNDINISRDGLYTISYKEYKEFDTELFKGDVGVRDLVIFHANKNSEGTTVNNPWCDSEIVVENTSYKWLNKKVSFKLYTEDGKRYFKWLDGTGNRYDVTTGGAFANFQITNRMGIDKTALNALRDAGTKPIIHFDDFCVTYDAPVDIKLVDKSGATIKQYTKVPGETITLKHADFGYTYAAQFEIDGVKYNDGDIYTVPAGVEEVVIKAGRYEMPETAPVNAIMYEDFEHTAGAYTDIHSPMTYIDEEYFGTNVPTFATYGNGKNRSYTQFGGRNVMKMDSKVITGESYYGIRLNNFYLDKPGKYVLSVDYYTDLATSVVTTKNICTLLWNRTHAGSDDYDSNAGTIESTFVGTHRQNWVNMHETLIITEKEGQLYIGTKAVENMPSFLWYMFKQNTEAIAETTYTDYFDNFALQRFAPVTVNVVNDGDIVIGTFDVYQNDTITLPAYNGTFTYGDATYNPGDTFTVPADAASVIEIDAVRNPMPSNVPANTVVYEDFQGKTDGSSKSSTEFFAYSAKAAYDTVAFAIPTEANDASISRTYKLAPGSTDDVVYAITSRPTGQYDGSIQINLPADLPVGKYEYGVKVYVDTDTLDTNDADGDGNTTEYLSEISLWGRIHTSSSYIGGTKDISFNSAGKRKTWTTFIQPFEVYEENEVKYIMMGTNVLELASAPYIKLHFDANKKAESYTVYYNDIYITCEMPTNVTASFYDEEGNAFAFKDIQSVYGGKYTFPTKAALGITYNPEYYVNDVKYFPGETIPVSGESVAFEVIVKKTNTIIRESFDDDVINSEKNIPTTYMTYNAIGSSASVGGGDAGDTQSFETVVESGRNVLKVTTKQTTNTLMALNLESLNLTEPGRYTVKMIYKPSDNIVDEFLNIQEKKGSFDRGMGNPSGDEDGYETVQMVYDIYRNADGVLCAKTPLNYTKTEVPLDGTHYADNKYIDYDNRINSLMIYHWNTAIGDCWYVDELSVDYEPYSLANTGLAGYRALNEDNKGGPEGIRFAAYVSNAQRDLVEEYGFIVTRKTKIETDGVADYTKLTLSGVQGEIVPNGVNAYSNGSGVPVIAAAAYIKDSVDKIYVQDGSVFDKSLQGLYDTFFTAVLYGLDSDTRKAEVFVARPYAKVNGVYYYGDCHEDSYNSIVARAEAANA